MVGDPALIISLLSQCASRNGRSISPNDGDLVLRRDSCLRTSRRTLGTLAALSTTLCLREECFDPGLIDEVECACQCAEEEEVEEDTGTRLVLFSEVA